MRTFIYSVAAAAAMAIGGVSAAFAQGHIIIQNANAAGVGFNDPTPAAPVGGNPGATLGQQRLNVFNRAAQIWEGVLQPRVDILVNARFTALGPNVLGSAGPTFIFDNFPGAEYPDMWYHSALADHLAGVDLEPGQPDIVANFSSQVRLSISASTTTIQRERPTCCRSCCTSSAMAWASRTSSTTRRASWRTARRTSTRSTRST